MFQLRKYTILEILAHFEFDVATRLKKVGTDCVAVSCGSSSFISSP